MEKNPYKDICLNRTPLGSILIIYDSRKKREIWLARLLRDFVKRYGAKAKKFLSQHFNKRIKDPNIMVVFEKRQGVLGNYFNPVYNRFKEPKIGKHFEIELNAEAKFNRMKKPKWIMWAYGNIFLHELLHLHGHKNHKAMELYLIPFNLWLADKLGLWKERRNPLTAEIIHTVFGNSELVKAK